MGKSLYLRGKPISMTNGKMKRKTGETESETEGGSIDNMVNKAVLPTNILSGVTTDTIRRGKILGGQLGGLNSVLNSVILPKKRSQNIRFN